MNYTKEYFIEKFENGPELGIGINNNCALSACGVKDGYHGYVLTDEAEALIKLFTGKDTVFTAYPVFSVNDDFDGDYKHLGSTPKERILNKLKSL